MQFHEFLVKKIDHITLKAPNIKPHISQMGKWRCGVLLTSLGTFLSLASLHFLIVIL